MAETNTSALPSVEELTAQLAAERAKNAAAANIIEEQSAKIAEMDAQKGGLHPVVTVDKVKYDIVLPKLQLDGKIVTAEEIQKDKALAAKLVKIGSGALVEQETVKEA